MLSRLLPSVRAVGPVESRKRGATPLFSFFFTKGRAPDTFSLLFRTAKVCTLFHRTTDRKGCYELPEPIHVLEASHVTLPSLASLMRRSAQAEYHVTRS